MGGIPYMRTRGPRKAEEVFEAIGRQTVSVPGALEMESRVRRLAKRAQELQALVTELEARIDDMSSLIPEARILTGVPGIGRVHAATIVCEVGDISRLEDANHLASYGGVAPARHESGPGVKKRKKRKGGNRKPESALISSARIAARIDPRARDYYARKLAQHKDGDGKPEPGAVRKALRALARRRVGVIYALPGDGSLYEPSHQNIAA
jgi:transposase